ncbi:hypothetical protein INT47_012468 [Mucor saturninus]|uniref:Helitron helicase-like domain-containing protein n=1 Tax=Mucor saturninus TaxID=64648 RepID=A0A8H7QH85_9FUNG|nr:hypothetical protein INT47_012468 [Mucor saturninus]
MLPTQRLCASCNLPGHSRRSNLLCPLNPRNTSLYIPQKRTNDDTLSPEEEHLTESRRSSVAAVRVGQDQSEEETSAAANSVVAAIINTENVENRSIMEVYSVRGIARSSAITEPSVDYQGRMDVECAFCGSIMWINERIARSSLTRPRFNMCCAKGKILLPSFEPTPPEIASLLTHNNTPASKEFFTKIRAYNSTLSFTSLGANIDHSVGNNRGGAYSFRIHGTICHKIRSILPVTPEDTVNPRYAQIYIYDPISQVDHRHHNASHLNRHILEQIQNCLIRVNPFVSLFKSMEHYAQVSNQIIDMTLRLVAEGPHDQRRYNAPTAEEVAVLIMNNEPGSSRDIVLHTRSEELQRINEYHRSYDSLHYVMMFPFGEDGWTITSCDLSGNKVTAMQWYSSRFMYRQNTNHHLHLFGRLFQQYVVDMYAKIEHNRMSFITNNQDRLRVDLYSGIQDAMNLDDSDLANLGRRVILPSSFVGSPRHMRQLYQDAMSIVRHFGKPDLFITFTCNPTWPEITNSLLAGQRANDRPDLCSRVFNLKLKELMNDLTRKHILGKVLAFVNVIEFQKRGLPHAHILLILCSEDKPTTVEVYDKIVSAELPDPESHPLAYETVQRNMMHGPCGQQNPRAQCMENGECKKRFPKSFCTETVEDGSGYPKYRRRDDGRSVTRGASLLDNRWVVPHNLYLCAKYNAHINVEICTSVSAVKYLYKYVYKGHDRAMTSVQSAASSSENGNVQQQEQPTNEVAEFLDARYVSASEACWRIFSFKLHQEHPTHQRLAIHLENSQPVYFRDSANIEVLSNTNSNTTLTAWFSYNAEHEESRQYLYTDFPGHFVWNKMGRYWTPRRRFERETIGRVYAISPRDTEKYFLRILLHNVRGATSFQNIRTVNGHQYDTNQAACRALNLLMDDNEWKDCIEEAITYQIPSSLRRLFAILLVFCTISDPFVL